MNFVNEIEAESLSIYLSIYLSSGILAFEEEVDDLWKCRPSFAGEKLA